MIGGYQFNPRVSYYKVKVGRLNVREENQVYFNAKSNNALNVLADDSPNSKSKFPLSHFFLPSQAPESSLQFAKTLLSTMWFSIHPTVILQ